MEKPATPSQLSHPSSPAPVDADKGLSQGSPLALQQNESSQLLSSVLDKDLLHPTAKDVFGKLDAELEIDEEAPAMAEEDPAKKVNG